MKAMEELIEWLNAERKKGEKIFTDKSDGIYRGLTLAINKATELNKSEWVSVSERLPEENGFYITWCEMPNEPGLIHYHKSTGWQNGFYNDRVTHWRIIIAPTPPINH